MSKPGPNCKAKSEVVEAGRIELPSEETNDRERSASLRTGEDAKPTSLIDLIIAVQTEQL